VTLEDYLARLRGQAAHVADGYRRVGDTHHIEPEVTQICAQFATETESYGTPADDALEPGPHPQADLLGDLEELYAWASRMELRWTLAGQAAQALRDPAFSQTTTTAQQAFSGQVAWLRTRLKQAAAQSLPFGP
jgi:hypothetical protein